MRKINDVGKSRVFRSALELCFILSFIVGMSLLHVDRAFGKEVTWWLGADPQRTAHRELRKAVADVNELGIADHAVILGDIVHSYRGGEGLMNFLLAMMKLEACWTYVLGNHDFSYEEETPRPIMPVHYSGRTVKGIRFIFLSDEVGDHFPEIDGRRNRDLVMSEEQEAWFREELETHKDKPIFLFTHQPHPEFQIWPELKARLDDYNIVAWISGHKHRWDINKDTDYGFVQVTVSAIRSHNESAFLRLKKDGDKVEARVRFRNHQTQEWIKVDGKEILSFSVDL